MYKVSKNIKIITINQQEVGFAPPKVHYEPLTHSLWIQYVLATSSVKQWKTITFLSATLSLYGDYQIPT